MSSVFKQLFPGIDEVDLNAAVRRFEEHALEAGDVVLYEGRQSDGVVLVAEGELEIRVDGVVVGTAGRGDLVGETALFASGVRTASVNARVPSRVLVLRREGYEGLRDTAHPVAIALERHALRLQNERLRRLNQTISHLADASSFSVERPGQWFFARIQTLFGRGGVFDTEDVDAVATLQRSTLFAGAPEAALRTIGDLLVPQAFGAGEVLCVEGEVGDRTFFLEEGEVDVVVATRDQGVHHLASLKPGAAFGMVSLAQKAPRTATCVAHNRAVCLVLDEQRFDRLVEHPYLAGNVFRRALIRAMSDQLSSANRHLATFERARETVELQLASASGDIHGMR